MIRFYSLLRRFDAGTAAVLFGVYTLLWGLWLLNPGFHTFTTTIAFAHLAEIGPEEYFALVAVLIGTLELATLFTPRVIWRQVASLAGLLFWSFIAWEFVLSNPESTAVIIASLAAGVSFLTLLRWGIR